MAGVYVLGMVYVVGLKKFEITTLKAYLGGFFEILDLLGDIGFTVIVLTTDLGDVVVAWNLPLKIWAPLSTLVVLLVLVLSIRSASNNPPTVGNGNLMAKDKSLACHPFLILLMGPPRGDLTDGDVTAAARHQRSWRWATMMLEDIPQGALSIAALLAAPSFEFFAFLNLSTSIAGLVVRAWTILRSRPPLSNETVAEEKKTLEASPPASPETKV